MPLRYLLIALLTTLLTGASGLIYEVTWQRYLANVLGSEAKAISIILSVFLGGLALGYSIFGRLSQRLNRSAAVRTAGMVEILIGLWGAAFPFLFRKATILIGLIPYDAPLAVDIILCVIAIGMPTVAMGATLPLLTQGLSRALTEAKFIHSLVYGTNTLGAFIGALLAGFALIPALGLPGTMWIAASLNLIMGLILLLIPCDQDALENTSRIQAENNPQIGGELAVAFLSGFISIGLQTLLIRVLALSAGGSEYTFAMVVGAFILLLALGAYSVTLTANSSLTLNLLMVSLGLVILSVVSEYAPYLTHILRTGFSTSELAFALYYTALFVALAFGIAPTVIAMGRTMPLLFKSLVASAESGIGDLVGRLYNANTLGCICGAIICGYFAPELVGLEGIYIMLIGLALTAVAISATHRAAPAIMLATVAACIGTPNFLIWNSAWISSGFYRLPIETSATFQGPSALSKYFLGDSEFLFRQDDAQTTVAVLETHHQHQAPVRSLLVNGKSDGSTEGTDLRTTLLLGHLPAMFTAAPRSAAVVGFGTGITVGALLQHESLQSIDVIEISSAVRNAAELFSKYNHSAESAAKTNWLHGDAFRVLGSSNQSYDLIVSEPSNPWLAGIERLFSDEFYKLVRSRLNDEGVYAQWFHTYYMSADTLKMVVSTFRANFKNVRIFQNDIDLILLGASNPISEKNLLEHFKDPRVAADLARAGLLKSDDLLSLELPAVSLFPPGQIQSLEHPRLAYQAGRDFFARHDTTTEALIGYFERPSLSAAIQDLYLFHSPELLKKSWCQGGSGLLCILATTALEVKNPSSQNPELALLRGLRSDDCPKVTTAQATEILALYRNFGSPWIPVSQKHLAELAITALGDPQNIATVYEALAFNLQQSLLPEAPTPRLRQLIRLANEASQSKSPSAH